MVKKKTKFSKFMNNPLDFIMLITIILLLAIGVIMVLSASAPTALSEGGDSYSYFRKQLIIGIAGFMLMLFMSKLDYRFYQKHYVWGIWISLILFALVAAIGTEVNGARRWLGIGDMLSFQPSEVVKILLIVFFAGMLTKNKKNLHKFIKGFVLHIGILAIPLACLVAPPQSHMSATVLILGVVIIMMIVAGCKFRQMLIAGTIVGIPVLVGLVIVTPYRLKRVATFMDPWSDPTGDGWQIIQSLYAIGSGGLFGVGLRR